MTSSEGIIIGVVDAANSFMNSVKGYLCAGKTTIKFVVCDAGSGAPGQALRQALENIFGTDVSIVLFPGKCGLRGNNPVPLD